ncbi:lysosomal alpha-glucosidase-like [Arctopsyche grandis]|uniref:lysosomal alpha-glucosidase-like n=1 Tax=Arctopsyche grandis TaxID=121162 RepID=UPI00406D8DF3
MKYTDGRDETDQKDNEIMESPEYYDKLGKSVKWYHKVLLNRPVKVGLALVIIAIVVPTLVYFYLFDGVSEEMYVKDGYSIGTCGHMNEARLQCGSENITFEECEKNCCYDLEKSFCYHRLLSRYSFIKANEADTMKPRFSDTPYSDVKNIPRLKLFVDDISTTHANFILYDPDKRKDLKDGRKIEEKLFNYTIYYPEFNIEVFSMVKNISRPLLSTVRGPLIASENIWEWSFHLSDDHLYGMGEVILNARPPEMLYNVRNRTSIMPFAMGHRNGSFHGIYIETVGPMEFQVSETKLISVRSFSGESLSIHFFYGERPRDVLDQFSKFIGRPQIPPYWALGVHFCSWFRNKV